jgi:hypothetical protein
VHSAKVTSDNYACFDKCRIIYGDTRMTIPPAQIRARLFNGVLDGAIETNAS